MGSWSLWGAILILQNLSFTFVSRARNSGSLKRHMQASVASNGIWFISQFILFNRMTAIMSGKEGVWAAIGAGVFYTLFTIIGALVGHKVSLLTERGSSAVGSSKRYAQITVSRQNGVRFGAFMDVCTESSCYRRDLRVYRAYSGQGFSLHEGCLGVA